ncbi:fmp52p [Saccharomyces arboricola H-6]|uniref:Protein FMP52, mitochondrial n=1 Tax=Saccharomyces arboricola (strain H-6 / AS 2.3317 / CBS 10644) TaxID=1160507 RepID=J8LPI2_SACAR|nr:fmp52p [Saccharomyces arboricola H-6]
MNGLVLGATGLCGGSFLKHAQEAPQFAKVYAILRRDLPFPAADKVVAVVEKDNSQWPGLVSDEMQARVLFTALATTRGAAGGLDNQYKIDHDLNVQLAQAAKDKGCETVVLVSSAGAHPDSRFGYMKMKGEIERDIIALNFKHTIILRPGPLLGKRTNSKQNGFGGSLTAALGGRMYRSRFQSWLGYPVYGDEVGKVGVHLALNPSENDKVQFVSSKDILDIASSLEKPNT